MKTSLRFLGIASSIALLSFTVALIPFYEETTDGDLSDEFDNPTGPFVLEVSDQQEISAAQQSSDVDYFTVTIPDGLVLESLVLDGYTAEDANNQAFLGMQEGASFTTDASSTSGDDLLGGITYGSQDLGTNLLIDMNDIGQGFDIPLQSGTYTFWLNQTGPLSSASLNFIVSDNLSVADTALETLIQVFPNPVQESLTIRSSNSIQVSRFSVVDITGKEVRSFTNPISVNLNTLAAGVYFGKIETNQGILTKKIIKQ